MKKLIALLLAMMLLLSMAACGGSDDEVESTPTGGSEVSELVDDSDADSATGLTDNNGNEVSQETIAELTEAYNAIAVTYNDIATAANENGWMADEQTAAELDAVSSTMGFVGAALTEDITMLDGTDFTTLIEMLKSEMPGALEELADRVAVPYEG